MSAAPPFDLPEPASLLIAPLPPGRDVAPLPVPLTLLVDREREVAIAVGLLRDPNTRLLTLTGPGGVGKTRLGIAAAATLAPDFTEGIAFVALAQVTDPDLVGAAIARALGLRDTGSEPLEGRLQRLLADQRLLLVLDNFEQVAAAAPLLSGLLGTCRGLKMLVTSRARLRLSGEQELPVPPLALPEEPERPDGDEVVQAEAVRLFTARAQAVRPDFAVTPDLAPTIAEIVRRLDGLPLAIELAAARIKVLPPVALLERLEPRLPLLIGGARDLALRQQTMRDTIAWSHDLLKPAEQALFRRLSVFVGGFTLGAAEAVVSRVEAAAEAGGVEVIPRPGFGVLEGVASLVEQSMVGTTTGPGDKPRYLMLETVREFARERLDASGEGPVARAAHATWVRGLAEENSARFFGSGYEQVVDRLETERDNVRAALAWAEAAGEADLVLQLAGNLGSYWTVRGPYLEARGWLERALEGGNQAPTEVRARALVAAGWLAHFHGELDAADVLATEALSVARTIGDQFTAARALLVLGQVGLQQGDYERTMVRIEAARTLFQELELTSVGGSHFLARAYSILGRLAIARGDAAEATRYLEEALRRQRPLSFTWGLGNTLRLLGDLARDRGDHERAMASYRESVRLAGDHGDRRLLAEALAGVAGVAAAEGRPEQAARHYGTAATMREQVGAPVEAVDRAAHERGLTLVRAAISPEAFAMAWADGAALSFAAAVAEAFAGTGPDGAPGSAPVTPDPVATAGLTAREGEVLRLLAEGLTDREIATALHLSPRTVGVHVTHVLAKLGVGTRTAAAAAALRRGLA